MKTILFFRVYIIAALILLLHGFSWGQQGHFVTDGEGLRIEGTGLVAYLTMYQGTTESAILSSSANDFVLSNRLPGRLLFSTNGSTRMTISNTGNLGLGTTSPSFKADIIGNRLRLRSSTLSSSRKIMLRTDGTDTDIQAENADLNIRAVGNDININPLAATNSDGDVWMNGTSLGSGATIEELNLIQSDINLEDTNPYLRMIQHGTTANRVGGLDFKNGSESVYRMNFNYDSNKLFFSDGFTLNGNEDLVIDVAMGLIDVKNTLIVREDVNIGGDLSFTGERLRDGGFQEIAVLGDIRPEPANPNVNLPFDLGTPDDRWRVVYTTDGVIQTSDKSMKNNVEPLGYGIDHVMELRPVSFQWKEGIDQSTKIGYIAQEVQKIIPEVVHAESYEQSESGEMQKVKNEVMGMSYTSMVPILTKAIQQQQALIEKLEKRITELESAKD